MSRQKYQIGSVHLIITIILAVALIGVLGFVFAQNLSKNDTTTDKGNDKPKTYSAYSVGDKISFADTDWIVIKSSNQEQDSVTLVREEMLSHPFKMGYAASYSESNAKEYLESEYLPVLGADNLKTIDGYRIRLIKTDEIIALGCERYNEFNITCGKAPSWVVNANDNGGSIFYTMDIYIDQGESHHWEVVSGGPKNDVLSKGGGATTFIYSENNSVNAINSLRPVINLLKDSI